MRRKGRDEEDQYAAGGFGIEAQPAQDLYAMAGVAEVEPVAVLSHAEGVAGGAAIEPSADAMQTDILRLRDDTPLQSVPAHATTNEHGQTLWADEAGVSWCQDPDCSLKRYDAESGTWVAHQ